MSKAAAGRCAILAGFETVAIGAFQRGAVGLLAGGGVVTSLIFCKVLLSEDFLRFFRDSPLWSLE